MDARLILLGFCFAASSALAFDHSHAAWQALLKKHVVVLEAGKASQMRYAGMAQDREPLRVYLQSLSAVDEAQFNAWSKPQQMAFLINAYNAYTIEKILARYPDLRSIWDFGKLFGNPFKDRFFRLFQRPFSLDQIEHDTLRKRYAEPRLHYALNCASVGCPMLREEAYVAERLERLDFRDPIEMTLQQSLPTPGCAGVNHADFSIDGKYAIFTCEFGGGGLIKVDMVERKIVGHLNLNRTNLITQASLELPDGQLPDGQQLDAAICGVNVGIGGGMPQDIRVSPDGKTFFVADMMADGVYLVDGEDFKQVGYIPTGIGTHGLYPSRDGTKLYVVNRGSHDVRGRRRGP